MPDQAFARTLEYIAKKTAGKRFARRDDIVPVEIKDFLAEVGFLTPLFDGDGNVKDVTVQLQGTHIVSFYGEYTGKGVREEMAEEIAERIITAVTACVETRLPTIAETKTKTGHDKDFVARALYVPLSENGKDVDRCFVHFRMKAG